MFSLIQHLVVQENGSLPEIPDCLYAYILAGNGVFKYARRDGLEVLIQVSSSFIAGLPNLKPFVTVVERIPAAFLAHALRVCRDNVPLEMLFWLNFDRTWIMNAPEQFCSATSVVPVNSHDRNGTRALIDLHSHGAMAPFFSHVDNKDELGFRVYAVIGRVRTHPRICVRVGLYGDYWDIPAATIFEMPERILDGFYVKGDFDEKETNEFLLDEDAQAE
jgi:PRTRC genetic system protein A